jgi:hypothetical protein
MFIGGDLFYGSISEALILQRLDRGEIQELKWPAKQTMLFRKDGKEETDEDWNMIVMKSDGFSDL